MTVAAKYCFFWNKNHAHNIKKNACKMRKCFHHTLLSNAPLSVRRPNIQKLPKPTEINMHNNVNAGKIISGEYCSKNENNILDPTHPTINLTVNS